MVVKNLLGVSLKNNKDVIGIYIILSFYRLYNTLLVLTIICRGIAVYEIDVFTFIIAYYLSVALRLRTTVYYGVTVNIYSFFRIFRAKSTPCTCYNLIEFKGYRE